MSLFEKSKMHLVLFVTRMVVMGREWLKLCQRSACRGS